MQKATANVVLSLQLVKKSFDSNKAVDDVNIEVRRGEIFGFLGPNGAGKSTTIRLILDILRPDSGNITILGRSNRDAAGTHRELGFLSGDMVLDSDLTGRQYVQLVNNLYGGGFDENISKLAETLEANLDVKIGMYSRGNRQKIGLIAALLHQPKLLILDEPTSGFDPLVQEKFALLLRKYVAEGGTVFMSSHVLGEVQDLCDRVAFIRSGRIIATKSVSELLDTSTKRIHITASPDVVASIRHGYKKIAGLTLLDSTVTKLNFSYAGTIEPLLHFFAGRALTDITIREPELEEIFGEYYMTGNESNDKSDKTETQNV
jgi:ABC-2 type transport system ATP-binding protein